MHVPVLPEKHDPRVLILKASLLGVWALVSFVCCFFARDLQFRVGDWPFSYWMAAQGAILVFIGILVFYSWMMRRLAPEDAADMADSEMSESEVPDA